jgi:hypothetical protein
MLSHVPLGIILVDESGTPIKPLIHGESVVILQTRIVMESKNYSFPLQVSAPPIPPYYIEHTVMKEET